jgi:predicted PolB exonuclease-like 3'-5' exonuclease
LPHYLQQIVAISVVVSTPDWVKVWSLGDLASTEKDLLERFFAGIERYSPILVSWNGSGFDLPVLHYRSLLHGVTAERYWETGETDNSFKWNNYLSRYHQRHTDLMDVLSGYQNRAFAPLDEMAIMLGYPGKMGMGGGKVWEKYLNGELESIRNYCETDVLNTYLIFLRYQLIRGYLNQETLKKEEDRVRECLVQAAKPHLSEFLTVWKDNEKL